MCSQGSSHILTPHLFHLFFSQQVISLLQLLFCIHCSLQHYFLPQQPWAHPLFKNLEGVAMEAAEAAEVAARAALASEAGLRAAVAQAEQRARADAARLVRPNHSPVRGFCVPAERMN